jgi:ATP-binding cassette subfamily F protein 3
MERETSEFSGGWQMRIALAKLLLREPTILMLDEPTNHLDIESLTWLEEYLKGYDGSVVVISHDRRFLDNLTRRTIEIAGGKASEYKGNYSYYLKEREVRLEMLRAAYENQQEAIRATMAFVDRSATRRRKPDRCRAASSSSTRSSASRWTTRRAASRSTSRRRRRRGAS